MGQRLEQVALKAIVTVSLLCCGKTPDNSELRVYFGFQFESAVSHERRYEDKRCLVAGIGS